MQKWALINISPPFSASPHAPFARHSPSLLRPRTTNDWPAIIISSTSTADPEKHRKQADVVQIAARNLDEESGKLLTTLEELEREFSQNNKRKKVIHRNFFTASICLFGSVCRETSVLHAHYAHRSFAVCVNYYARRSFAVCVPIMRAVHSPFAENPNLPRLHVPQLTPFIPSSGHLRWVHGFGGSTR